MMLSNSNNNHTVQICLFTFRDPKEELEIGSQDVYLDIGWGLIKFDCGRSPFGFHL